MRKSLYSTHYQAFLSLLRTTREASGLTQIDLAKRLRATQSFVSKCERGERRLDVAELVQWCTALDISLVDFMARYEGSLPVPVPVSVKPAARVKRSSKQ
jgi:transcriptional regulator with XRE-family HTH domain